MFRVEKFFFLSLRNFGIIYSSIVLIIYLLKIMQLLIVRDNLYADTILSVFTEKGNQEEPYVNIEEDDLKKFRIYEHKWPFALAHMGLMFICCLFLFIGILWRKAKLLIVYLIPIMAEIMFTYLYLVIVLLYMTINESFTKTPFLLLDIQFSLTLGFNLFVWVCVLSLRKEIEKEEKEETA